MNRSKSIRCLIRRAQVLALPEERVRQAFLRYLIEDAEVPKELIAVEYPLTQFPHLAQQKDTLPPRRVDIVVFSQDGHDSSLLVPLLLVECKAVPITSEEHRQIVGYNVFVRAPHIALVNEKELWWQGPGNSCFQPFLPSFRSLLSNSR